MDNQFFERPILNSPYDDPMRHWELDDQGQPTQQIIETRRRAEFITPIPKPRKRKGRANQQDLVFDEGKGLSTQEQQYDQTSIINELRHHVDLWRNRQNPNDWHVTPETARLLQHWRHHQFSGIRPFFCQIEAVETAIWLTEVAPKAAPGKGFLEHLANANHDANPELMRLALKLATGAGKTTVMAMIIAYARSKPHMKFRPLFTAKTPTESVITEYSNFEDESLNRRAMSGIGGIAEWSEIESKFRVYSKDTTTSSRPPGSFPVFFRGKQYTPGNGYWKTGELGFSRLIKAGRLEPRGTSLRYVRFFRDYPVSPIHNIWRDVRFSSRREDKLYVVQSSVMLLQRCLLMATDPGDLVLDPTCGSGNYDAHSSEFNKLGRIPVLKARMNADLHMADDLKNTGKGNLFVIFGEPDIEILPVSGGQIQVKVNGVDVFHPNTGEVRSDGADGIACWFIDTDYNEESFFVRHAYFLGANDPYKALKTTLKAEVNEEAWSTLHSDIWRPFKKPESGRIAVKVINHLGDEVMKVFRVD
jgi:hypothetical protein